MRNIAFFTYSPNMWDGFQTLWESLSSDPENNVSVIAIPNHHKTYDNQLDDIQYYTEGYPSELNIHTIADFSWNNVHFDEIYIQFIQDDYNLGFSLPLFFQTKNLKRITDKLIYVPYNIVVEPQKVNAKALDSLSPFLIFDSLKYADQIIVQSEAVKNIYLALLAGENEVLRQKWAEKITWENYPRRRLIERFSKETIEIPENWKEFWDDSVIGGKEIILLCSSVQGILAQNRSLIRKTMQFFEETKSADNNVFIIWRPYPMLFDVIPEMRPELVDDFNELIDYFTENNLGIIDCTPSPTASIVLSDKYVGDPCGVMELFKTTGKPIMKLFKIL